MSDNTPGLIAVAREILVECKWKHDQAMSNLSRRVSADKDLSREAIDYALANVLREVTSQQRVKFHSLTANKPGIDDTSGLALLANESFLETYQLLNSVKLGDARKSDLEAYASHHAARAQSANQRMRFVRAILKSPKFKDGKRVRDCFTDLEIARLAGELKC